MHIKSRPKSFFLLLKNSFQVKTFPLRLFKFMLYNSNEPEYRWKLKCLGKTNKKNFYFHSFNQLVSSETDKWKFTPARHLKVETALRLLWMWLQGGSKDEVNQRACDSLMADKLHFFMEIFGFLAILLTSAKPETRFEFSECNFNSQQKLFKDSPQRSNLTLARLSRDWGFYCLSSHVQSAVFSWSATQKCERQQSTSHRLSFPPSSHIFMTLQFRGISAKKRWYS